MISTVLLDFYNTLYAAHDWFDLEARTFPVEALRALGREPSPEEATALLGAYAEARRAVHVSGVELSAEDGIRQSFAATGVRADGDLPAMVDRLQRAAYRPGLEEPGAAPCVRALREAGYTLGVVSNALSGEFIRRSLAASGLLGCFDGVFASAEVGYYKTSPRLYEAALAALGARADEAAHVGDSYRFDVLGAKAAGLRAVWYAPGSEPPPGLDADAVIRRLSELPGVVARLNAAG